MIGRKKEDGRRKREEQRWMKIIELIEFF